MPDQDTNDAMIILEGALSAEFENAVKSQHAYNRTGNGLKEFAYYVADPGDPPATYFYLNQLTFSHFL